MKQIYLLSSLFLMIGLTGCTDSSLRNRACVDKLPESEKSYIESAQEYIQHFTTTNPFTNAVTDEYDEVIFACTITACKSNAKLVRFYLQTPANMTLKFRNQFSIGN